MKRYLTTEQRRSALKLAYNDRDWVDKVDTMSNKQVYAIFDNLKRKGMIVLDGYGNISFKSKGEIKKIKEARKERGFHQITLDEFFGDLVTQKENERKEKDGNVE